MVCEGALATGWVCHNPSCCLVCVLHETVITDCMQQMIAALVDSVGGGELQLLSSSRLSLRQFPCARGGVSTRTHSKQPQACLHSSHAHTILLNLFVVLLYWWWHGCGQSIIEKGRLGCRGIVRIGFSWQQLDYHPFAAWFV